MTLNIAIIEDQSQFADSLISMIKTWADTKQVFVDIKAFDTSASFFERYKMNLYDLIILDVLLPNDISGFEIAKRIREHDDDSNILFATSLKDNFNEGFRYEAIQYLVKPIDYDSLAECLDKTLQLARTRSSKFFSINNNGKTVKVPFKDVLYFSSFTHSIEVFCVNENYKFRQNINELASHLPKEFVRCHRSIITNINHIYSIDKNEIVLDDNTKLPVSRTYSANIMSEFLRYYGNI